MKKRGVEMSMNVIIIAAIAVIILVILVLLVTDAFKRVKTGTGCEAQGGSCEDADPGDVCGGVDGIMGEGYTQVASDCGTGYLCCIQPFEGR